MHNRFSPWALLLVALALPFAGCSNPLVDTLSISPSTASLTVNQTLQLTAIGTVGHGSGHPSTTQDDTAQAKWTSSNPAVASVSNTTPGLVTALTSGTTTITASMNGYTGLISATAAVTVAGGTTGIGTIGGITSLSVIPSSQSVAIPGDTTQFLAIGTSSTGATTDLTTAVTWKSASQQIATIGATTGFATAVSQGSDAIIAEYTNPSGGSTVTGTGTFSVSAGLAEQFTAVTIVPGSESLAAGGSANLTALATQGGTGLQQDVTNLPNTTWLSSDLTHVTVTSGLTAGNGVVTDAGVGPSTITVEVQNQDKSIVSGTAAVTGTSTTPALPILSLTVIPGAIAVGDFQLTGQFLAIATYATPPYVRDVTNDPCTLWISTLPEAFPVSNSSAAGTNSTGSNCGTASTGANLGASGGIVTAYASGQATIAEVMSEDNNPLDPTNGTIQTAQATFSCPQALPAAGATTATCYPGEEPPQPLLSTLTIFNEGVNTTNWYVTAASATATPNVLHCGPGWALSGGAGGSVCTATYPENTVAPPLTGTTPGVLIEAQQVGAGTGTFGGWSTSCAPSDSHGNLLTGPILWTANGPNYCVAPLSVTGIYIDDTGTPYSATVPNTNVTVGVIFN
jgi:hypothetical protein